MYYLALDQRQVLLHNTWGSLPRLTSLERYYTVFVHWFNMTQDLLRQSRCIKESVEMANEFYSAICFRLAFRELFGIWQKIR